MGTSQSSSGAPSGVPMVPPWVPDIAPENGADNGAPDQQPEDESPAPAPPPQQVPIAPTGRFGPSRTSLGRYASSGSGTDMRRGLGHYVAKGLGGSSTATRRFGGTARTAGALYGALSAVAEGRGATGSPIDPSVLEGRSAREIMDAIMEAVQPVDGTQDAEANRLAIRDTRSELLNRFPEADLRNLSEEQRLFVVEQYIALDVYNQFVLDVGKSVQDKAPSATTALARLKTIKNYIRQTVSAAFRRLRSAGQNINQSHVVGLSRQALNETFRVFEGYVS